MARFQVGDEITVVKPHGMKAGARGTIAAIADEPAYAVAMDGMPGPPHKWYVASELKKQAVREAVLAGLGD